MSGPQLPARLRAIGPLGEGAAGSVWRAWDEVLGREVAVKVAHSADTAALASLKGEFRLMQGLQRPGLAVPLEVVVDGERALVLQPLVEGVALEEWVAGPDAATRWARVRAVLPQLVDALGALHAAGICHGDIKPPNVRVDADGAPWLLDFGLARDLDRGGGGAWGGTPAYLAPEVLAGGAASPAADLYALGAMVHELVSGLRRGPMSAWQPGPGLRRLLPGVDPALLGALDALLDPTPERRPTVGALLAWLDVEAPAPPPFVGREGELAALQAAAARATGAAVVVRVVGESGIGKSELVRTFARGLEGWTTLWGRAHALDHVPHNALDDVLHELAVRTEGQVSADAAAVFPALRGRPTRGEPAAQPEERRRRAWLGVAALVTELAACGPLLIVLDDVQWADAPSAELLAALVAASRGPILWVVLHRPSDGALVRWLEAQPDVVPLPLGPLPSAEARALWGALGGQADEPTGAEAGHPLFLRVVAGARDPALRDVAAVTADQLAALDPVARRTVETVALSPEPLVRAEVRMAAGLGADGVIVDLVRARWLTLVGAGGDRVECVHHQVGDVVRRAASTPVETHRALLRARRVGGMASPAVLWQHARGGDLREEAASEAWRAAEVAEGSLAFEQAVDWYTRAEEDRVARPASELHERLAMALVHAGRGGDAVGRFRAAARGLDPTSTLRLEAAAAEQEVLAGRVREGLGAFNQLLTRTGDRMPAEDRFASREATWRRVRSLVCGWRPRQVRDLPADAVQELEVLRRAMTALSGVAPQLMDCLGLRVLDRARALGSRRHLVLALGLEACLEAMFGGRPFDGRADAMLAWADEHVGEEPYLRAFVAQCHDVAHFSRGAFREAAEAGGAAVALLRQRCPGTECEVSVILSYTHHAWWWMGELDRLRADVERALQDALRRGDGFAANTHRLGEPALVLLADDAHALALARCEEAEATWPDVPFHVQRYLHLLTVVGVHLYRGEAERAWARVEAAWPALVRGNLLALGVLAMHLWAARGRAAVATGREREVKAAIRGLRRLRLPQAPALAELLEACWRDDRRAAADVAARFDALGAPLWAAAARWRATGDAGGLPVRSPERFAAMLAPLRA